MAYSRVRTTGPWRTLEYELTTVVMYMYSRIQKLPRVRGDSYTGSSAVEFPAIISIILWQNNVIKTRI